MHLSRQDMQPAGTEGSDGASTCGNAERETVIMKHYVN